MPSKLNVRVVTGLESFVIVGRLSVGMLPLPKSWAPMLFTSEPGIFAELVSISSTRSARVSGSAYFIKSIELRPTFDLFLGACRGLPIIGRVPSAETLILLWFCRTSRLTKQVIFGNETRTGPGRGAWEG
jgi:hypothetical protein